MSARDVEYDDREHEEVPDVAPRRSPPSGYIVVTATHREIIVENVTTAIVQVGPSLKLTKRAIPPGGYERLMWDGPLYVRTGFVCRRFDPPKGQGVYSRTHPWPTRQRRSS